MDTFVCTNNFVAKMYAMHSSMHIYIHTPDESVTISLTSFDLKIGTCYEPQHVQKFVLTEALAWKSVGKMGAADKVRYERHPHADERSACVAKVVG